VAEWLKKNSGEMLQNFCVDSLSCQFISNAAEFGLAKVLDGTVMHDKL